MKERKIQRVFLRKSDSALIDNFYAIFKDDKIYKWDYQTGEWRPFWKQLNPPLSE